MQDEESFKRLDPNSPLGVVAEVLQLEGQQRRVHSMVTVADVCVRRAHDADPDMRALVRAFLFLFAYSRNIDIDAMIAQVKVH